MIINNFIKDYETVIKSQGLTNTDVSEKTGINRNNIKRSIAIVIPKAFISIWESLGYDIKITYVKRNKSAEEILKGDK